MREASKKGRVSAAGLGFTFAGCFLGAGYVSGRELWEFFGRFGVWGFADVFTVFSLFGVSCIMTAGVGALAEQAFQLPTKACALVFALLVVHLRGFSGFPYVSGSTSRSRASRISGYKVRIDFRPPPSLWIRVVLLI